MKRKLRIFLLMMALPVLLVCTAFATDVVTEGIQTAGRTTANPGCTVTYDAATGKYTASTKSGIIEGEQYALLVVKKPATGESRIVSEETVMYIDQQAATAEGVTFDFIPMSTPNCEVLLGGKFTSGKSPVVLGEMLGNGVTVTGSVTSYNPNNAITLELYAVGTTTNPVATATIAASSGSGRQTQAFQFNSVPLGRYDLKISKQGHTVYWLTGIPVEGDLDLRITPELLCGDINGDGNVNSNDLILITSSKNYNHTIATAQKATADLNGDGNVNANDLVIVTTNKHYNKTVTDIPY